MPVSKDDKPASAAAAKKDDKTPDRGALTDELEDLKARGNPDPARLAELKKEIAAS